jgi:hypothetical protein
MPELADVAGLEQAGSQEPGEPGGPPRQLGAPLLELGLAARGDAAGDGDRDRFSSALRRVVRNSSAQPTSASQSRFSRESRMCRRNIDAVDPSKARWS